MLCADTNLFLYAANPECPQHRSALNFFETEACSGREFVVCELVLIEIYMQLRNPAFMRKPLSANGAAEFCATLRSNPDWQVVDYEPAVAPSLWRWAKRTGAGFRRIIAARLALTLRFHGVSEFATANVSDFTEFGFSRLWDPL